MANSRPSLTSEILTVYNSNNNANNTGRIFIAKTTSNRVSLLDRAAQPKKYSNRIPQGKLHRYTDTNLSGESLPEIHRAKPYKHPRENSICNLCQNTILPTSSINEFITVIGNDSMSLHITYLYGDLVRISPWSSSNNNNISFYSGSTIVGAITASSTSTSSVSMIFLSGSLNSSVWTNNGNDSGSISMSFYSGSLIDMAFPSSQYNSQSNIISFYTGSLFNEAIVASGSSNDGGITYLSCSYATGSLYIGFLNGILS